MQRILSSFLLNFVELMGLDGVYCRIMSLKRKAYMIFYSKILLSDRVP